MPCSCSAARCRLRALRAWRACHRRTFAYLYDHRESGPRLPPQVMCISPCTHPVFPGRPSHAWSRPSPPCRTHGRSPTSSATPTSMYIQPAASFIYVADLFQRPPSLRHHQPPLAPSYTLIHPYIGPRLPRSPPRSENTLDDFNLSSTLSSLSTFLSPLSFPTLLAAPPTYHSLPENISGLPNLSPVSPLPLESPPLESRPA